MRGKCRLGGGGQDGKNAPGDPGAIQNFHPNRCLLVANKKRPDSNGPVILFILFFVVCFDLEQALGLFDCDLEGIRLFSVDRDCNINLSARDQFG